MFDWIKKIFGTAQSRQLKKYWKIVGQVNVADKELQDLPDEQLRAKTEEFRARYQKGESLNQLLPEAYAVVKNVCRRLRGTEVHVSGYSQRWDMVPYDVQVLGAIGLHYGFIAEMQTGEGKTLTASMPLYLNAISGKPVHLVTVNDYLVQRDCDWIGAIFRWLGLTTGALTTNAFPEQRKAIYNCDIVYGTASEFGFDYLRDHSSAMRKEDQVQRGYYFAIVDEIDSILIDEARTPLIISGPVPVSRQMYDELKDGVASLVIKQRDFCNKLATDAKKVLEQVDNARKEDKVSKELAAQENEAYRRLWLVSKGTPRNRILKRVLEDPDTRERIERWDIYYYAEQNKEEKAKALAELYIIVDEKANEYELTDKGISTWIDFYDESFNAAEDFIMLDLGAEYAAVDHDKLLSEQDKLERKIALREEDAKRKERAHNLRQLFRAHLLMEKDVDYIVQEHKVVIVDENTGRPQPGRRYSDGLHQAIEAKEAVPIQRETQTYATVTLQNYFRMYEKLAGMSGTAITEAKELKEIYKLDVLVIPTHRPCLRIDHHNEVYMTEREKYAAILKDIKNVHEQGRPILVGTESVEVSEKISRILKQNQVPHQVLNAKHHEQEAEIVAHAGTRGAITISTNMAGRGTDIKLAPGIAELGGLYVLGTTRHQSRRIDRQLGGRCARLGDPGSSKFYLSFEDNLLRLFISPRLTTMLKKWRPPEGEAITDSKLLDRAIETAQKRIEQRNYMSRKHTLEYDNVMNKQRQEVYKFRDEILWTDNLQELVKELVEITCTTIATQFFSSRSSDNGWQPEAYRQWLMAHFPVFFEEGCFDDDRLEIEQIELMASDKVLQAFHDKVEAEQTKALKIYGNNQEFAVQAVSDALRHLLLNKIDSLWQEHLLLMDYLRSEIHVRTIGQKDPLLEFKHESFKLFDRFNLELRTETVQELFKSELIQDQLPWMSGIFQPMNFHMDRSFAFNLMPIDEDEDDEEEEEIQQKLMQSSAGKIVSLPEEEVMAEADKGSKRNDPCTCGSGKKYKKCCGKTEVGNRD
ncbi:MAG: secA [Chlamydiales bacterium]|jgi:preprotein translocase subunit SecA|nr:secA [Chlamydiales bacterium]